MLKLHSHKSIEQLDKGIGKDIEDVSNTINHHNLADIYRTLHSTTVKCIFKKMYSIHYARL